MRYFVVAKKWDSDRKMQVNYIAGMFDDFVNARIFKEAYNQHYSASAEVVEAFNILNN